MESRSRKKSNKRELVAASHQIYPKHFADVSHHPRLLLRTKGVALHFLLAIQVVCQVLHFFFPNAQEKDSSASVFVWACASSAKKNRTYCWSSRTYINRVTGGWRLVMCVFENRSAWKIAAPLLLLLEHFFLSCTSFLDLLHSPSILQCASQCLDFLPDGICHEKCQFDMDFWEYLGQQHWTKPKTIGMHKLHKISTILAIYLQHFKICHNCFQVFFTKRFGSKGPDGQGPIQEAAPSIRPVTTADCGNFGFDSWKMAMRKNATKQNNQMHNALCYITLFRPICKKLVQC